MEATIANSFETLPDEMKQLKRWLLWKGETKYDNAGNPQRDSQGNIKLDKVPKQSNGYNASKTNPSHYMTFETAMTAYETGGFSGIGFVLVKYDPYVIIDIDDCFNDSGKLSKKAESIVNTADSYTELSQSGNGLHIIVKGDNIDGFNNQSEGVEAYSQKWFFSVTGNVLRDDLVEIEENNMLVDYICDTYRPQNTKKQSSQVEDQPERFSDDDLVAKIRKSKQGDKFSALYDKGDTSKRESNSEADFALANILAWWSKNNSQIERIMRNSALYRKKWDEHPDYLKERTIQGAMSNNEGNGYGQSDGFHLYVNEGSNKPTFVLNEDDTIKKTLYNLKQMIMTDDKLNGLGFNEFTEEITINGQPITDFDISEIRLRVDYRYQMTFKKDDIIDVLNSASREINSYHPIKQMIESENWDGTPRAETIFIDYLGAVGDHYMRSVARKWLAGAVARIYDPGVKMDIVPVLQGGQGIGKSTMAGKLGGDYFVDSLMSMGDSKDDYQMLIDSWIIELSELSSMNSTKVEKVKGFISAQSDKMRMPYGKVTRDYKRTCAFIGTTNTSQFLNDLTGNRRFFPIPLEGKPKKDVFSLDEETIQQIWAEALEIYKNGEQLFLDDEFDQDMANYYRQQATEDDMLFSDIEDFLTMKVPNDWDQGTLDHKKIAFEEYKREGGNTPNQEKYFTNYVEKTSAKEIAFVLGLETTNKGSNSQLKKINMYMENKEGWKKQPIRLNGKPRKGFKRID